MTLEECAKDCAGYIYFGVEYGGECLLTLSCILSFEYLTNSQIQAIAGIVLTLDLSQLHSLIAASFAQGIQTNIVGPETVWSYTNSPQQQALHPQQYPQQHPQPQGLSQKPAHRQRPVPLPRKPDGCIRGAMLMA
jgi:hypothetical protein